MKLVIFEDDQFGRFLPLVWVRGVFELKSGATTLAAKIARAAGAPVAALLARDYLAPTLAARCKGVAVNDLSGCRGEEVLFVNARVRGTQWKPPQPKVAQWHGDQLAVWRTTADVTAIRDYAGLVAAARQAERADYGGAWFDYIWHVMLANPDELKADFVAAGRHGIEGQVHESAVVFGPREQVYVAAGAEVHPFVCIDTRNGPVTIEARCEVHPYTRIEGPCYVGPGSILLGTKVREGCSIGPMCRVGGRGRGVHHSGVLEQVPRRFSRARVRRRVGEPRRADDQQRPEERLQHGERAAGRQDNRHRLNQGRQFHFRSRQD
jgi:carbonic anhydrase/acetyltransferase-like protein (isoleucine patch superfamily)